MPVYIRYGNDDNSEFLKPIVFETLDDLIKDIYDTINENRYDYYAGTTCNKLTISKISDILKHYGKYDEFEPGLNNQNTPVWEILEFSKPRYEYIGDRN